MKILFSPSETKNPHALLPSLSPQSFIFPLLYEKRMEVLNRYQSLLSQCDGTILQALFGIKDIQKCLQLASHTILTALTCKAINRYSGVAYDYLDYANLSPEQQTFIDEHTIIFSNLFGPLLAKDAIPDYKLQQGSSLGNFKVESFYKEHFSAALDDFLKDEFIIDLRAGFYEKFYTLKQPYVTMKFLKNGKVVSHFAKAYRGLVLRQLSLFQPSNEAELRAIAFEHLRIEAIIQSKLKTEYVFTIID